MSYVLLYVTLYLFWVCNHLDGKKRSGCFAWFVLLVSCDICVALLRGAMGLSAISNVEFPIHTHFLFLIKRKLKFRVRSLFCNTVLSFSSCFEVI